MLNLNYDVYEVRAFVEDSVNELPEALEGLISILQEGESDKEAIEFHVKKWITNIKSGIKTADDFEKDFLMLPENWEELERENYIQRSIKRYRKNK